MLIAMSELEASLMVLGCVVGYIADADRVIVAMNDEATAQHIVNCVNAMRFFDPKTVAKAASQTDPQNALIELAHPEGYHVS
jgi:hypothetical protein